MATIEALRAQKEKPNPAFALAALLAAPRAVRPPSRAAP